MSMIRISVSVDNIEAESLPRAIVLAFYSLPPLIETLTAPLISSFDDNHDGSLFLRGLKPYEGWSKEFKVV